MQGLCKTLTFARFLCHAQILILKIRHVLLGLKFSPSLNFNEILHFSRVSKHPLHASFILVLIYITGCITKPVSKNPEPESHIIALKEEYYLEKNESIAFFEACKCFNSCNEKPDYLKCKASLQNFMESYPLSSWARIARETLILIEAFLKIQNENLKLKEEEKKLLNHLSNEKNEQKKLKEEIAELLNINKKLRKDIQLLRDIDVEIENKK